MQPRQQRGDDRPDSPAPQFTHETVFGPGMIPRIMLFGLTNLADGQPSDCD